MNWEFETLIKSIAKKYNYLMIGLPEVAIWLIRNDDIILKNTFDWLTSRRQYMITLLKQTLEQTFIKLVSCTTSSKKLILTLDTQNADLKTL